MINCPLVWPSIRVRLELWEVKPMDLLGPMEDWINEWSHWCHAPCPSESSFIFTTRISALNCFAFTRPTKETSTLFKTISFAHALLPAASRPHFFVFFSLFLSFSCGTKHFKKGVSGRIWRVRPSSSDCCLQIFFSRSLKCLSVSKGPSASQACS